MAAIAEVQQRTRGRLLRWFEWHHILPPNVGEDSTICLDEDHNLDRHPFEPDRRLIG